MSHGRAGGGRMEKMREKHNGARGVPVAPEHKTDREIVPARPEHKTDREIALAAPGHKADGEASDPPGR